MPDQSAEKQPAAARRFELGDRVTFSHVLERKSVHLPMATTAYRRGEDQEHWLPKEQSGEGFVIGYRTLSNGYTTYDREEGNEWHPVGYCRCALVAFHLYRKPAFVPLDSLSVASPPETTER